MFRVTGELGMARSWAAVSILPLTLAIVRKGLSSLEILRSNSFFSLCAQNVKDFLKNKNDGKF